MRFELNETVFAVQFEYSTDGGRHPVRNFIQPLLYDDEIPTTINFIKLEVSEHHLVRWTHDEKDAVPRYDGFILKDETGRVFHNQYPTASYGQVSTEADNRFFLPDDEGNARTIYSYNLLSDVLEKMQEGIRRIEPVIDENHHNYKELSQRLADLKYLKDRIVSEFQKKYPEYDVELKFVKAVRDSMLTWPKATIAKKA